MKIKLTVVVGSITGALIMLPAVGWECSLVGAMISILLGSYIFRTDP